MSVILYQKSEEERRTETSHGWKSKKELKKDESNQRKRRGSGWGTSQIGE